MLTWEKAKIGGVRVQAVCPYCGTRVKHPGQIDIKTRRFRLNCSCGAVLRVLFSESFEWEKDIVGSGPTS